MEAHVEAVGLTTRDPRMVERKKYGQKKARKKTQFQALMADLFKFI